MNDTMLVQKNVGSFKLDNIVSGVVNDFKLCCFRRKTKLEVEHNYIKIVILIVYSTEKIQVGPGLTP